MEQSIELVGLTGEGRRSESGSDVANRKHLPESLGARKNLAFDPGGFAG